MSEDKAKGAAPLSLDEEIAQLEGDIACMQFAKNLLCMRLKVLRALRETRKATMQPVEHPQAWSDVVREADRIVNHRESE